MFTNTTVNSVAFTPEDVQKNLHLDLINYLLSYNQKSEDYYFDIHITTDRFCTIVEFACVSYEEINDNGFVFMDDDHFLLKRVVFPDGHYDFLDDDEAEEVFNNWLKEHPGWVKDEFGRWHSKEDCSEDFVYGDTDGDKK